MFFCPSVQKKPARKYVFLSFRQKDISKEICLSVLLSKRHQQGKMSFCPSVKNDISKEKCSFVLLSNSLRPSV